MMKLASNNIKKIILFFVLAIVLFITMVLLFKDNKNLVLIDDKTNMKLMSIKLSNDNFFSIEYIHSVNKSKIIDYYTYNESDKIYVYKTIYYNFGAGVETELMANEILSYGDDGSMIISNINKIIDPLIYIVGTVSDHILKIDNTEFNLNKLFGENRHIRFEIQ